jgi:hypothetical protein
MLIEMTENEIRSRIVTLAFGGDERLFIAFYRKLQQGLPKEPASSCAAASSPTNVTKTARRSIRKGRGPAISTSRSSAAK